jgi:transcriptional regulator with XRE-family HTH domain
MESKQVAATFWKQVRKVIKASGKTRYAIAKALGINQGHLAHLMKGEAGLSVESLIAVLDYLGLELTIQTKAKKGKSDEKA